MKAKTARRFIIGCLVSGIGGLWAIHKLYADHESKRLTALASAYIAKDQRQSAAECLITAIGLYPQNTEARRLLLQITPEPDPVTENNPSAPPPPTTPTPIAIEPPTPTPTPIAIEPPTPTPPPAPPDPAKVDAHLAAAQKLLAENNSKAAESEMRAAMAIDPTDKSKSQLTTFLLNQTLDAKATDELVGFLRELGRNQSAIGAEALAAGAARGIVPAAEIESWLTLLRAHPAATSTMLFTVDRLEAQLRPREQHTVAENAAKRLRSAPLPERDAAMRWLSSIGEYSLGASLVSLDEAKLDRSSLEGWLAAQSNAGNFDAILSATAAPSPTLPVPTHTLKLFRGHALSNTGKPEEGLQLMREACQETGTSRAALVDALAILAILHAYPLFEEELTKAVSDPDTTASLIDSLTPAVHLCGDAVVIRRFYEIAAAAPALRGNERILSDRDHFRTLLGLDVDLAELAARSEAAREPSPRITYIHALLNAGQPAKALIELEDKSPAIITGQLSTSQQAVVAATFAANGRLRDAIPILARMPQQQLTMQEREWLRGHFNSASKSARASQATTPFETRYPWISTARRIAIDLGALFALFAIWKIGQRVHLWLRREAIG